MRLVNVSIVLLVLFALSACEKTKTVTETITEIVTVEPPPPVSAPVTVNVDADYVSGNFLIGGVPTTANPYVHSDFYLRDQATGAMTPIGRTTDQGYDFLFVHGAYDIFYDYVQGWELPLNKNAMLSAGIVIDMPATRDIDVEAVDVRPSFTLNGAPFPPSIYQDAVFYLEPVAGGELVFLGKTSQETEIISVLPGAYNVIYSHEDGDQVPVNKRARVRENVVLSDPSNSLEVDVSSAQVRAAWQLDGAAFPESPYVHAEFWLRTDSGDEVFLGDSFDQGSIVHLIPGEYDAEYRFLQSLDSIPIPVNSAAIVAEGIDASLPVAINVTSATLTVKPTLNGAPFPVSAYADGVLELHEAANDAYTEIGRTRDDDITVAVVANTYDLLYSHEDGPQVPQNHRAVITDDVAVSGAFPLNVDVIGYSLTGEFTLQGSDFPVSQADFANIILRGANSTEDIVLFPTNAQDEPVMVLAGTYDVFYACQVCTEIPFNSDAPVMTGHVVAADGAIAADLGSARIEVFKTLNGGDFPASPYASGFIWGGIGDSDRVNMGRTSSSLADIIVLPGNYNFWYEASDNLNNLVPINAWALVDQQTIDPQ